MYFARKRAVGWAKKRKKKAEHAKLDTTEPMIRKKKKYSLFAVAYQFLKNF